MKPQPPVTTDVLGNKRLFSHTDQLTIQLRFQMLLEVMERTSSFGRSDNGYESAETYCDDACKGEPYPILRSACIVPSEENRPANVYLKGKCKSS